MILYGIYSAETDFEAREYLLMFNYTSQRQSFIMEAVDDNLSENEEWFILYLNVSHNQCAVGVSIQDNDREFLADDKLHY